MLSSGDPSLNAVTGDDRVMLVSDDGLMHSPDGGDGGTARPPQSEIAPLQLEGHSSAERSYKSQQEGLRVIIIGSICFAASVTVALILTIYLGPPMVPLHGGVVSDNVVCSQLGVALLRQGGGAADAAVGTVLCVGLFNPHHSGIGGGGFALIRQQKTNFSEVIDFMDSAPGGKSISGGSGRQVAVPGMIRGLQMLHSKYGKLAWRDVVMAVVEITRNKLNVSNELRDEIRKLLPSSALASHFGKILTGNQIDMSSLGAVLQAVAVHGDAAFYEGQFAEEIISEVNGSMTVDDLKGFKAISRDAIRSSFLDMVVETVPAPGGGPLLLLLLNVLENATRQHNVAWNSSDIYHYIIESSKFAMAQQRLLGDPDFSSNVTLFKLDMETLISKSFAGELASRLEPNQSHADAQFYSDRPTTVSMGTSHVSVIGPDDEMISITASLNGPFGSGIVTRHGVILNSHMTSFDQSATAPAVRSGQRPVTPLSPVLVFSATRLCGLRLALGAAHGKSALQGLAQVIVNIVAHSMNLTPAIEASRVYDRLEDQHCIVYDLSLTSEVQKMLHNKGDVDCANFNTTLSDLPFVHGLGKINQTVYGQADYRGNSAGTATVY